jgi:hypothetical protein
VDCSEAANTVFWNETLLSQGTADQKGNGCFTIQVRNSPEFPFPPFPANAFTQIQTLKSTSYDPTTETGTNSFTVYNGGPGISCNGSVLVNQAGAPEAGHGTGTTVFSRNGGIRVDGLTNTFVSSPVNDIDNLVGLGASFKQ